MVKKNDRHKNNYVKSKVARWDMFARFIPISLLCLNIFLVTFNYVDFENAFWITMALASVISCVWWVWTITTIRLVRTTLKSAEDSLLEVKTEVKDVIEDVKDFRQRP